MTDHHPLLAAAPLGKSSTTPSHYDAALLFPIPRAMAREGLHLTASLPFIGADYWTGYELGWLNAKGKPQVGMLQVVVPCETPNMVESKSFKLYLNSFNNHRVDSSESLAQCIARDINAVLWQGHTSGGQATVKILLPDAFEKEKIGAFKALSIDRLDIEVSQPQYDPTLQRVNATDAPVEEALCSDLLRALCRVTGQPDWGSIQIYYAGRQIDQAGLLEYIIGFRDQQEFHEPLAERIFVDIMRQCKPSKLQVLIRFTRRGGMDINPVRQNFPGLAPSLHRLARQ